MRSRPCTPNRNGWTAERRSAFIVALGDFRSVTRAAAAVGMSRESAYWLRRQPEAAEFRAQWDAVLAFEIGDAALEALAALAPERWSNRRIVRWLNRMDEDDGCAKPTESSTS